MMSDTRKEEPLAVFVEQTVAVVVGEALVVGAVAGLFVDERPVDPGVDLGLATAHLDALELDAIAHARGALEARREDRLEALEVDLLSALRPPVSW